MEEDILAENPDLLRAELGALEEILNCLTPDAISSRFTFEKRKKVLEKVLERIKTEPKEDADETIILSRKDLQGFCTYYALDDIRWEHFEYKKLGKNKLARASKVVFIDNDGSEKVLKDKYGK